MIEERPRLTLRRPSNRPTKQQIEALTGMATAFLADAMNGRGALDYRIKGLAGTPLSTTGVAITCRNGPDDNLGLLKGTPKGRSGPALQSLLTRMSL